MRIFNRVFVRNPKIDRLSEREVRAILKTMRPLSLRMLLNAIDLGRVDGRFFHPKKDKPLVPFVGCLLGWGGFLEGLHHRDFRFKVFGNPDHWFDLTHLNGAAAEYFITLIHENDLPSTNPYLAILRKLVVEELEKCDRQQESEAHPDQTSQEIVPSEVTESQLVTV